MQKNLLLHTLTKEREPILKFYFRYGAARMTKEKPFYHFQFMLYVNFQTNSNQKFFFRFHLTNRRLKKFTGNSQISKQCDVKHALLPPMNVHRFLPILCASMKQNILLNFCCHRLTISCHYIEACIILGSKGKG